jgi:hypothetical protein
VRKSHTIEIASHQRSCCAMRAPAQACLSTGMAQKTTLPEPSMFARRRWHFPGRLTQNPDHPNLPELYDVRINLAVSPVVLRPTGAASYRFTHGAR